jgi:excinuclease ABC subunit B
VNVKAGTGDILVGKDIKTIIAEFEGKMREAAANLEFEEAARLRDEIKRLEAKELGLDAPGMPASIAKSRQKTNKAEIDAPIQPPSGRRPRR